jgi:hypothetical protein
MVGDVSNQVVFEKFAFPGCKQFLSRGDFKREPVPELFYPALFRTVGNCRHKNVLTECRGSAAVVTVKLLNEIGVLSRDTILKPLPNRVAGIEVREAGHDRSRNLDPAGDRP